MLIGYAYTPTNDQDLNQQRIVLLAAGCTRIYEDRLTMGDPRPEQKRMFDQLCETDTVVVTSVARLTHGFWHEIAKLIDERKAGFRSLAEPWMDLSCIVPSILDYKSYQKNPTELRPIFDAFVNLVFDCETNLKIEYPYYFILGYKNSSGIDHWQIWIKNLLKIFLDLQDIFKFEYKRSVYFCEKLRRIGRWFEIEGVLEKWYKATLKEPFLAPTTFPITGPRYRLKDDVDVAGIDPVLLQFACYIAVGMKKYGASYKYLAANEIFEVVTLLGSDLPSQLKKHGSGELPRVVTDYRDSEVTFKANDAFATIKIVVKDESEDNYRKVLDHLVRLLESEFPRSYAIEFRSPDKTFLPIEGLPRKGVNQLFANAVTYRPLWPLIEQYARLAMRKFEWYSNTPEDNAIMPGTFAVFALALADDAYCDFALDYLRICDGEHQSAHANLINAYIAKYGFTSNAIRLLIVCAGNIQNMSAQKIYPALIANKDSLQFLAQARENHENKAGESKNNTFWAEDPYRAWQNVLISIWGETATSRPEKIVQTASEDLRSLYRSILRPWDADSVTPAVPGVRCGRTNNDR